MHNLDSKLASSFLFYFYFLACICSDGNHGPEGSRVINDKCYMKDTALRNWTGAGWNCAANNMSLANFVTQADYDAIQAMIGEIIKTSSEY